MARIETRAAEQEPKDTPTLGEQHSFREPSDLERHNMRGSQCLVARSDRPVNTVGCGVDSTVSEPTQGWNLRSKGPGHGAPPIMSDDVSTLPAQGQVKNMTSTSSTSRGSV